MLHTVTHFIAHASPLLIYSIVGLVLALESCGIPIANSTLLLFTGALASQGHANIWILGIVAFSGSIIGACAAYVIGERGGKRILLRIGRIFRVEPQQIELAVIWYHKAGIWLVFASRIIPYIRPYSCFPAGITRTPFARFFASVCLGSALWCAGALYAGWHLGKRWVLALDFIQAYTLPSICGIILLTVLYFLALRWLKKRLQKKLLAVETPSKQTRPLSERELTHS